MKISIPNVEPDTAFLAVAEPGIDGRDGRDGKDGVGRDGRDGVDGLGFNLRGEWKPGTYQPHDVVEHEGSSYVAKVATKSEPPSRAWQLLAARGEDGERGPAGQRGASAPNDNTVKAAFDQPALRGNVVRVSGNRRVDLALAHGSDAAALAVGLATGSGSYVTSGPFTVNSWSFTPGEVLYLSPTVPGGVTNVFPDSNGDRIVILGTMLTPDTIHLNIHYAGEVGT